MPKTRQPAVAGTFYPDDKTELTKMIKKFLASAKNLNIKPKCLIVPHAGYIYSGPVAAVGYAQLKNLEQKHWKIILLGPSHHEFFSGAATSPFKIWETPLGNVKAEQLNSLWSRGFDTPRFSARLQFKNSPFGEARKTTGFSPRIEPSGEFLLFPNSAEAHVPEHCLEVQLPFLQLILKDFTIMPILTGEVEPEDLARELIKYLDKGTILIISSDLSHYHSYEEAKRIDAVANKAIPAINMESAEKIEVCGKTAILTAMHIAKELSWRGYFLDYKNSGDTAGPKNEVVGYGAYAFTE